MQRLTHKGACHCGAVSFEFKAPPSLPMTLCNCSICELSAYQHIFVKHKDLTFLSGQDHLTHYSFGTGMAQHMFCKTCGIKPLYQPRSHPDSYSVNYRCITSDSLEISETIDFDGQNWDQNISGLHDKTSSNLDIDLS